MKDLIGLLILNLYFINKKSDYNPEQTFTEMIKSSSTVFIVMPSSPEEVDASIPIVHHILNQNKRVTVLLNNSYLSKMGSVNHLTVEEYFDNERGRTGVPKAQLRKRLRQLKVDVVIDLTRDQSVFGTFCSRMIHSPFFAGFSKTHMLGFYNFLFHDKTDTVENSYKNFLNCLLMF